MLKYNKFIEENNLNPADYRKAEAYCLGNPWENEYDAHTLENPDWLKFADELAQLVAAGIKTATASDFSAYAIENVPLPEVDGKYDIILDSKGQPICAIKTTKVYIEKFSQVTADHAFKEGEGDRSLAYWRRVHEEFFTKDGHFDPEMEIVCEEFEVIIGN